MVDAAHEIDQMMVASTIPADGALVLDHRGEDY